MIFIFSCESRDSGTWLQRLQHLCHPQAPECEVHNCSCQRKETNMEPGLSIVSHLLLHHWTVYPWATSVQCLFSMSLILTFLLRGRREYYEIFLHFASILFLILSFERIFLVIYMICSDMNCLWSARWRTWTRGCCWRCGRRACSGTRPSATTGARLTPSPSPSRWVTRTTLRESWSTWSFLWVIDYFSFGWIE